MPQLDPSNFSSQVFWLAVTFIFLYFAVNRIFLKKINSLIEEREAYISRSIKKAEQAQIEAEQAKKDYLAKIDYARKKASLMVNEAIKEIQEEANIKKAEYDKNLIEMQKKSDKNLREFKINMSEEIITISSYLVTEIVEKLFDIKVEQTKIKEIVKEERKSNRIS